MIFNFQWIWPTITSVENRVISCLYDRKLLFYLAPMTSPDCFDWICILIYVSNDLFMWHMYRWWPISSTVCVQFVSYLFLCSFSVHAKHDTCIDIYSPYDIWNNILGSILRFFRPFEKLFNTCVSQASLNFLRMQHGM